MGGRDQLTVIQSVDGIREQDIHLALFIDR